MKQRILQLFLVAAALLGLTTPASAVEYDELSTSFVAEEAWLINNYLGQDNLVFLTLTSAGYGQGWSTPTKAGCMLRVALRVDPAKVTEESPVPAGEYQPGEEGPNTVSLYLSDYLTAFEDPQWGLDAAKFQLDAISLNVEESNGEYNISANAHGIIYDNEGEMIPMFESDLSATFNGRIQVEQEAEVPTAPEINTSFSTDKIRIEDCSDWMGVPCVQITMYTADDPDTEPGQVMQFMIQYEGELGDKKMPTGFFDFTDDWDQLNAVVPQSAVYSQYFLNENGERESYDIYLSAGYVYISEAEGVYGVDVAAEGSYTDPAGNSFYYWVSPSFLGRLDGEGEIYPPLEAEEFEMSFDNINGYFYQGYVWVDLWKGDVDQYLTATGEAEMMHLGFHVYDNPDKYYLDYIDGVYTASSLNGEYDPGHFVNGVISGLDTATGSFLSIYNEEAQLSALAAFEGGTLTVTRTGDNSVRFEFDFISEIGTHLTGSWEGDVLGRIEVLSGPTSGLESVVSPQFNVTTSAGVIYAPADAQVFTIDGKPAGREGLAAGIYIVRGANGETAKVVVK